MSDNQEETSGNIKPQQQGNSLNFNSGCVLKLSIHTANITIPECGGDVDMESQLAEDGAANESKESCVVMQEGEGACPQGGEDERREQEEMSQDGEGDQEKESGVAGSDEGGGEGRGGGKEETVDEEDEMSQDRGDNIQTQQEDVVAASDGGDEGRGGEGKTEPTGKEEQQSTQEGEDLMSQDEEDTTHTETEPAGDDRLGDEGGEGREEETQAGASGVDKGAKVEEMASQGSTSDTDSDSEPHQFDDYTTLKEFGYHFKDGIVIIITIVCN